MPCSDHHWQPLKTWAGRYRCTQCRALAYKLIRAPGQWKIIVYRCAERGCMQPAQEFDHRRRRGWCTAHYHPSQPIGVRPSGLS